MYTDMIINVYEASVPDGKERQLGEDFDIARSSLGNWSCSVPIDHEAMTSPHDLYIGRVFRLLMLFCISPELRHFGRIPHWLRM